MNLSKMLVGLGFAVLMSSAMGSAEEFYFYPDCPGTENDCMQIEIASVPGGSIWVKKDPVMTVGKDQITEAFMKEDRFGKEEITIRFIRPTADKFAQVTQELSGKRLAVVVGGKVILAPYISGAITEGSLSINAGVEGNSYLDSLPWLKKMTQDYREREQRKSLIEIVSLSVLGFLLISAAVYFTFFRKRPGKV